jgi:molybdopterin molybdotransferase
MSEFFTLVSPNQALQTLIDQLNGPLKSETIPSAQALNRTLSADITSPSDLPAFSRSTMDGYAVRADDTYGATPNMPAYLSVAGEIHMGTVPTFKLEAAQAALIHTGGMLPENADAVIMVENTQTSRKDEIEIFNAVSIGENILNVGEDVTKDSEVIPNGSILRPQDIGALMALGITSVDVTVSPTVGLISTGDEVVHPDSNISPGQVRDINSYSLSALVQSAGGTPKRYGVIEDDLDTVQEAAETGSEECDILVIAAGSSVSARDITSDVINNLGEPGVLIHGIALKPGKPTILAVAKNKPIFGLPGNPVSAMVVARLLLVPTIKFLCGSNLDNQVSTVITAELTHNIPSIAGREDHVPVLVRTTEGKLFAEPVFGKSNLIFTLVRSTGSVIVPINSNGFIQGSTVQVHLY